MNAMFLLWLAIGISAGVSHVWMVWRASQPPFQAVAWHAPRLLVIGGVLFASAIWGGLLPMVAGWMVAYVATVALVTMRSPV